MCANLLKRSDATTKHTPTHLRDINEQRIIQKGGEGVAIENKPVDILGTKEKGRGEGEEGEDLRGAVNGTRSGGQVSEISFGIIMGDRLSSSRE